MYNPKSNNYTSVGGVPHNVKGMSFATTGSPRSNIALGASSDNHHYQVPIQPDNVDLLMTAATALTSLTRPQGHAVQVQQGNREVLSALHGMTAATRSTPMVHTPMKRKGQRQKATRFPVKLMQVLSSGRYDHIISWTPDGLSFVVKKPSLLVSDVLPLYFKEVKYTSFTRKLHRWGFVKILRGKELSAYFHKSFRRGDFDGATQMHCSKTTQPITKIDSNMPKSKITLTKTDPSSDDDPTVAMTNTPTTETSDQVGMPLTGESSDTRALDLRRQYLQRDMQLMELQMLREREALSMPALQNNQFFAVPNGMMQANPGQQLIMQGHHARLSFPNEFGMSVANAIPQVQNFEFARARHAVEHQRIMANAWNVLSRERNKRLYPTAQGQDSVLRNINVNYPPSA